MSYEHKLIKYKTKFNLIKNQVGGKDCDIRHSEDLLATSYIKDITDFIPFEKSILHPFRKHPVCSYSIWDKSHTQLYVPTPPEPKDKLYASQKFYIRLHKVYFKSQIKGEDEGIDLQAIMWSQIHQKWYELENWPLNDSLLEQLLHFLNVDDVLSAKTVINNLYMFRNTTYSPINPENLEMITELMHNAPSVEVINELERYSPTREMDEQGILPLPENY
jgi:hypothetical protein